MATDKICFKTYVKCLDDKKLSKTRKRVNKKSHKGRYYGGGIGGDIDTSSGGGSGDGGVGESYQPLIKELTTKYTKPAEEEQELSRSSRYAAAKTLFNSLLSQPEITRGDIIDSFMANLGVTDSTATSYFQRIAKEMGLTNISDGDGKSGGGGGMRSARSSNPAPQMEPTPIPTEEQPEEEPDVTTADDDETGTIRYVKHAHLVYKRRDEQGTFEELWVYSISDTLKDSLEVRRAILAGTDIPPKKIRSADGKQKYKLTTLGNAQLLHITGLPN